MSPRPSAWSSLGIEDRHRFVAHVCPLQANELLDALTTRQKVQPQGRRLGTWPIGDQLPIGLQFGLGERPFGKRGLKALLTIDRVDCDQMSRT